MFLVSLINIFLHPSSFFSLLRLLSLVLRLKSGALHPPRSHLALFCLPLSTSQIEKLGFKLIADMGEMPLKVTMAIEIVL